MASESAALPYELADADVDKPLKRPQQIEALLSSGVAWGELAPAPASRFSAGTPTYKKLYHASARFLDAWGVFLTVVDAKLTLYTLPLHANPHKVVVLDETKHTQLVAVHDEARVVCTLSKSHTLRVFDWTVNRSLELRATHELSTTLAGSPLVAPGVLPVQKMALLDDSHVLLAFKKDWCVVHLDSGAVLEPVAAPASGSSPFSHHALRIRIVDSVSPPSSSRGSARKRVAVDRVVEYNVTPRAAVYHHPFVLWDLQDKLAVYNSATMKPVQTLPIQGNVQRLRRACAAFAGTRRGQPPWPLAFVCVAAPFTVHVATMTPIATSSGEAWTRATTPTRCSAAYARDLFRRKQFETSMTYFGTARVPAKDCLALLTEREDHRERAHQELLQLVQQENDCDVGETEVLLRAHLRVDALLHFYAKRKLNPSLGLSIFTQRDVRIGKEDIDPVQILDASSAPSSTEESNDAALPLTESRFLAIEYVTQVVNDPQRRVAVPARLHDDAVYLLLDAIHAHVQHTKHQSASAVTRLTSRVALQRGLLGQLRRKLLAFLESPQAQYHPERMLSRTPPEMIDERAALLARLGRHHEVLQLLRLNCASGTRGKLL
ncbi:hypothetical protein PINS_up021653 [Pythium insidiosum]|nr:hypothetical protein PINS_up021653 [Pythium insidiosum]